MVNLFITVRLVRIHPKLPIHSFLNINLSTLKSMFIYFVYHFSTDQKRSKWGSPFSLFFVFFSLFYSHSNPLPPYPPQTNPALTPKCQITILFLIPPYQEINHSSVQTVVLENLSISNHRKNPCN